MPERIRVLHVITTTIGGAGEHVLLLAKSLDKSKFDVTVAFGPGMPLDAEFEAARLRVVRLPLNRSASLGSAAAGLGLTRLMRKERFDIVHTHTSVAGAVGRVAARISGRHIVVHMLHALAGHDNVPIVQRSLLNLVERVLDLLTDHYIGGSDAIVRNAIAKGIARKEKVSRIYYALDVERFDQNREGGLAWRDRMGIPANAPLVGFVGRLERQKGVEDFLLAAAVCAETLSDVRFVIVGDGPLRSKLIQQTSKLGLQDRVTFVGWLTDIPPLMRAIEVLMVPSRWEAFGIVNLEAMAAQKPIVATNVEGIPEVVEHGRSGFLVEPGDVPALAKATLQLLEDPNLRAEFGVNGRRRLEQHFSPAQMVSAHEELYSALLARRV
jgi:glycosyltransferase involved in cell wall biosynthesis